jgi:hypothetical protein
MAFGYLLASFHVAVNNNGTDAIVHTKCDSTHAGHCAHAMATLLVAGVCNTQGRHTCLMVDTDTGAALHDVLRVPSLLPIHEHVCACVGRNGSMCQRFAGHCLRLL